MIICLHSYAFGPHGGWVPTYLVDEAIRRTSKLGYSGIELDAARPHLWPYDLDKEQIKQVKNLLQKYHLSIPAISGYYAGLNFASPIEQERKDASNYLVKCVELCADLGAKVLVVVPGVVVFGVTWKEAWQMALSSMTSGIKRAEELGIIIGIEYVNTLWSNLVTSSFFAYQMMEECNSQNVKLVLDSAHAFYNGENIVDVVKFFGNKLVHVHFEDCVSGAPETRTVPGKGDADLISFIEALKENNYDAGITIELWGPQPEKYARESLDYMKEIM